MKNVSILRVMTAAPATVAPTSSAAAAERVMREHRCHHVPVVDAGRLVGMVGARDLMKAVVLGSDSDTEVLSQAPLETRRVADIMQRAVVALPQTATLLDAAEALANGDLHALPIVAPNGVLAGIVTSTDVIETLVDALRHPTAEGDRVRDDNERGKLPDTARVHALRAVYRAALNYLESGRAELEHSRLLQAVGRAREALDGTTVRI